MRQKSLLSGFLNVESVVSTDSGAERGKKIKSPKVKIFVGVWISPCTHPCPNNCFPLVKLKLKLAAQVLLWNGTHSASITLIFLGNAHWFSAAAWKPCFSRLWPDSCTEFGLTGWFTGSADIQSHDLGGKRGREREKRGMHQKSNICTIIINNNKDKCQPQVTPVAPATPFNILTVACGPCVALDSVWCLQRG